MKKKTIKRKQKKINKLNDLSKNVIRVCLLSTFFVLSCMLSVIFISWADLLYYQSKGVSKSPLFDAYVIVTDSMIPTININDAVVVKRIKNNNLDIGDVITFSSNDYNFSGLTITHRVVEKRLGQDGNYIYKTKGDHNDSSDVAMVENEDIYGKAIMVIPKVGYIYNFVASPIGFVLSTILPVLLVVCYEIWRVTRECCARYKEVKIL